jgi:flagellar basal-body rod protein FlgB
MVPTGNRQDFTASGDPGKLSHFLDNLFGFLGKGIVDLNKLTLFQLATKRMAYMGQRERVLSENVANANTPGYTPKDLKPMDFRNIMKQEIGRLQPTVTNGAHLVSQSSSAGSFQVARDRSNQVFETSPDGNAVSLEQQMIKVADTQNQYQLSANLFQKHLAMLKTAIGHS